MLEISNPDGYALPVLFFLRAIKAYGRPDTLENRIANTSLSLKIPCNIP